MSDSRSSSTASGGGIGVVGLLGVAFVVLKLVGVIHWSWLWVLAPFWLGAVAAVVIIAVVALVVFLAGRR